MTLDEYITKLITFRDQSGLGSSDVYISCGGYDPVYSPIEWGPEAGTFLEGGFCPCKVEHEPQVVVVN